MGIRSRLKSFFSRSKPQIQDTIPLPPMQTPSAYHGGSPGRSTNYGGSTSGGGKWDYGLSASGRTVTLDHYALRQNVRDAMHDSLEARSTVERFTDTIVDIGLVPEVSPDHTILNMDPETAEEWGNNVERRFKLYAKDKKQHRAGHLTFFQAQRLYQWFQQRDNDILTRLYYSNKRTLQNPLQFSFIDPNQIRGSAWTSSYTQYGYDDGITRNPDGTEKAYKVWLTDPNKLGAYKDVTIPKVGVKSGRLMMLHGFNPEYAGQGRGFPRLAHALQEFENITDFKMSILKKAINQSNLVLSVENQQQDPGNPFEGIQQEISTTINEQTDTSTEIINNLASFEACRIPESALDTPGSVAVVGNEQGDNLKLLDTKAPADNFKEFISVYSESIAASLGIAQEVVLMKFSNNYSASRATLLLFWRVVEYWREEMAADFLNPIFESWLSEEIAAGRISAPGWSDPILRAAWLNIKWIGAPLPSIDPKKEADARKLNLEMSLTTLDRETRALNGSDAKTNIEKNKKLFPEMPIPPWAAQPEIETESDEPKEDEADNE